jgi:hypothetical protein
MMNVWLMDGGLVVFFNTRPLLQFQEVQLPFPCDGALWAAPTAAAWRKEIAKPRERDWLPQSLDALIRASLRPEDDHSDLYGKFLLIHGNPPHYSPNIRFNKLHLGKTIRIRLSNRPFPGGRNKLPHNHNPRPKQLANPLGHYDPPSKNGSFPMVPSRFLPQFPRILVRCQTLPCQTPHHRLASTLRRRQEPVRGQNLVKDCQSLGCKGRIESRLDETGFKNS